MRFIDTRLKLAALGLFTALAMLLASCNVEEENGRAYMKVEKDSAWAKFDTLIITWTDPATGKGGTLYEGDPDDLPEENKLAAEGYAGQKIEIRIKGIRHGTVAFEEKRTFDGVSAHGTIKEIITAYMDTAGVKPIDTTAVKPLDTTTVKPVDTTSVKPVDTTTVKPVDTTTVKPVDTTTVKPVDTTSVKPVDTTKAPIDTGKVVITKPDTQAVGPTIPRFTTVPRDTTLSIKDSLAVSAGAVVETGALKGHAWDFNGDGKFEDSTALSGNSATFGGKGYFPDAGVFKSAARVWAGNDSAVTARFTVTIVEDKPVAFAGRDTTVYPDASVRLRGQSKDGIGHIAKTEWKFDGAPFVECPADTAFPAGAIPRDIQAIFRVTDDDGQSASDTLVIHVVSRSESNLTDLYVSNGTLSPAFDPGLTSYADTVPYETETMSFTASGLGSLKLNGGALESGKASDPVALKPGPNSFTIEVKQADALAKTYTVAVVRSAAAVSADLATLKIEGASLDKPFSPQDSVITVSAAHATASAIIAATAASGKATVSINDAAPKPGSASATMNLALGPTSGKIVVTAQSGATRTYVLRFNRALYDDNTLSNLGIGQGALEPAFTPEHFTYKLKLGFPAASIDINAVTVKAGAGLSINGKIAVSGTAANVAVEVGTINIPIVVTPASGSPQTYTVTVTRTPDNADLSSLAFGVGTLAPVFAPATTSYTLTAVFADSIVPVTPILDVSTSTLAVNGIPVVSGATPTLKPRTGSSTFAFVVKSGTGATKTYSVKVLRGYFPNATLTGLTPSAGALSPAFERNTLGYADTVPNSVTKLTLTPKALSTAASIWIGTSTDSTLVPSGSPSAAWPLKAGANKLYVDVFSKEGPVGLYSVTVVRTPSTVNDLTGLTCTGSEISPAFTSPNLTYSCKVAHNVTSTKFTAYWSDTTAKVTFNSLPLVSGTETAVNLNPGANVFNISAKSQTGTIKTYSLTVNRIIPTDASLSGLTMTATGGSGTVNVPVTAGPKVNGIRNYYGSPVNGAISVKVVPTVSAAGMSVKVNGQVLASGTESNAIAVSTAFKLTTVFYIEVTSVDGDTKVTDTVFVVPPSLVAYQANDSWYCVNKSFDGGATWFNQMLADLFRHQDMLMTDPEHGLLVGQGGAVLMTADGGLNWDLQTSNTSEGLYEVEQIAPNTAVAVGINGTIIKSTDGGKNWSKKDSKGNAWLVGLGFADAKVGYAVGYYGEVLRTGDGGESWALQFTAPNYDDLHAVEFFDATRGYLGGKNGLLYYTEDGGATWTKRSTGLAGTINDLECTGPNLCFAAMSDGSVAMTENWGEAWTNVYTPPAGDPHPLNDISFPDYKHGYIVGSGVTLRSTTLGLTWEALPATLGGSLIEANTGAFFPSL